MSAEARYRLLLLAYPSEHRVHRGEEMLEVLLATEDRRGRWSAVPEAASLVAHGLAVRARAPLAWRAPDHVGVAGVGLALLLAVLGVAQLVAMALRGLGLDGYPDGWMTTSLWVDPRWPVAVAWIATAVALLLDRPRLGIVLAWSAVLLDGWMLVGGLDLRLDLPGVTVSWIGDAGPGWELWITAAHASWGILTLVTALLIGGPRRTRAAVAALPARRWAAVPAAGLVGVAFSSVAAPVAFLLGDGADIVLAEDLRSPAIAFVLAASALAAALLRSPYARGTMALLGLAGLVPVLARWSDPGAVLLAGGALFVAGFVAGRARPATGHERPSPG